MTARAKCDKCHKRPWKTIISGRRYCGPCRRDRLEEKAQRHEGRSWRRA